MNLKTEQQIKIMAQSIHTSPILPKSIDERATALVKEFNEIFKGTEPSQALALFSIRKIAELQLELELKNLLAIEKPKISISRKPSKLSVEYNNNKMICWVYGDVGEEPIKFTFSPELTYLFSKELNERIIKYNNKIKNNMGTGGTEHK